MRSVVEWAEQENRRWAFTDGNAGAKFTRFFNSFNDLGEINWESVEATDFRETVVKEGKQAEFLLYESFPWQLVERIGVMDSEIKTQVETLLEVSEHKSFVSVEQTWCY